MALDGEICVVDEKGNEDFGKAVSAARRKSEVMKNYRYKVFDVLPLADFWAGASAARFSERQQRLASLLSALDCPRVQHVEQARHTEDSFAEWSRRSDTGGWEGLMLRRDAPYQGKRSKDVLKVKKFFTGEYVVENVTFAPMRFVNEETGLEEEMQLLKAAEITHKGHTVSVGSGWSLEQRQRYYVDPDALIGQTIEVQYFEETQSRHGYTSLRFPTVKYVWGDARDA